MKALQGENDMVKQFTEELAGATEFYIGMALVTKSGLKLVLPAIERCLERHGRGYFLFGIDLPTDPDAVQNLMTLQTRHAESFEVRRFQSGTRFFHSKVSVFVKRNRAKTAIIGSSNLTGGGLGGNFETNALLDCPKIVRKFHDYFEEQFQGAHAKQVDQPWLDQYQRVWIERSKIEQSQRRLRDEARSIGKQSQNVLRTIKGHAFAFTGKINGWPRKRILYPRVKRRGGLVAKSIGSAGWLVEARIMGGRQTTRKLMKARQLNIRIITEEEFMSVMRSGKRHGFSD